MSSLYELPDVVETVATAPARRSPHLHAVPDLAPLDFDAAVRTLTPRLQRYATRRLGDRHEAEELVQEALLRAYGHRATLATEDDLAAWTTCVTGRLVIDRLRVRGRSTSVAEVPEGTRVGRDTADVVVARDEARTALDALDAMPARQAAVLWAREVEGLAYGEIGERFGMTEPAVRSVLSRARKALRKEFASRGGTLPAAGLVALAPWIDGLTWADRLRRAATRAATPAALGLLGIGALTGLVMSPWSAPADAAPVLQPLVTSSVGTASTAPLGSARTVSVADAAVAARRGATAPAPGAQAAPVRRMLDPLVDSGINDTCAAVSHGGGLAVGTSTGGKDTAGAGGAGCASAGQDRLQVGPDLPVNPAGVHAVGVESRVVDCASLPSLPVVTCTPAEGNAR